jgi:hypothetical protein
MHDEILEIYKLMAYTDFDEHTIEWVDMLIQKFIECPVSDDDGANVIAGAALAELQRIRVFLTDTREFPELPELLPMGVAVLAPTILSYIQVTPGFIQGGFVFVLAMFVFPVTKWHYSLLAQASEVSFTTYLLEHDPDVFQLLFR